MNQEKKFFRYIGIYEYDKHKKLKNEIKSNLNHRLSTSSKLSKYNKYKIPTPTISSRDLYNYLQDRFGDNWEITKKHLTVFFPEITVVSSNKLTHTIREIYIRWYLDYNNPSPDMLKAYWTHAEDNTEYLHSHVDDERAEENSHWSDKFCWGQYLNQYWNDIKEKKPLLHEWLYYQLVTVEEFLKQEDVAAPYSAIQDIAYERDEYWSNINEVKNIDFSKLEIFSLESIEPLKVIYNRDELISINPNYNDFLCIGNQYSANSNVQYKSNREEPSDSYFKRKKIIIKYVQENDIPVIPHVHEKIIKLYDAEIKQYISDRESAFAKAYKELHDKVYSQSGEGNQVLLRRIL